MEKSVFSRLGMVEDPIFLAPLAGVSDHPFRRVCRRAGADLAYVEMISAAALLYENKRTLNMCKRHEAEDRVGIQITGRSPEEVARAVALLDTMNFETIDINMGCPVQKVVKNGCGSAILKNPQNVFQMVRLCKAVTAKPLSVKIRLGWDKNTVNAIEVAKAAEEGGADWLTIHGRTRADDYSVPVDLEKIGQVKRSIKIPVLGNGNIFSAEDLQIMKERTGVDGIMVSRGALGNPWVFAQIRSSDEIRISVDEWHGLVLQHINWQAEEYGMNGRASVCMRKHLLWYSKGWPAGKAWREKFGQAQDLEDAKRLVEGFAHELLQGGHTYRDSLFQKNSSMNRFLWDPKYDMDRQLDRGDDCSEIGVL